jgi:hypothetical protein
VIIPFNTAETSLRPTVAETSNSKAHFVSTSVGVTFVLSREITFSSTLIFISFEIQISLLLASSNIALKVFCQLFSPVISFSKLPESFVKTMLLSVPFTIIFT